MYGGEGGRGGQREANQALDVTSVFTGVVQNDVNFPVTDVSIAKMTQFLIGKKKYDVIYWLGVPAISHPAARKRGERTTQGSTGGTHVGISIIFSRQPFSPHFLSLIPHHPSSSWPASDIQPVSPLVERLPVSNWPRRLSASLRLPLVESRSPIVIVPELFLSARYAAIRNQPICSSAGLPFSDCAEKSHKNSRGTCVSRERACLHCKRRRRLIW